MGCGYFKLWVTGQLDGLEVYTFTDTGVALSATVAGTKYYKDDELSD